MLILSYDFVRACLRVWLEPLVSRILFPQASALTKSVVIFIFIRILTEIILIRGIVKAILSKIADKRFVKSSSK